MKQSDSTSSLTELTEVISEVECFICLEIQNELKEPLVDSNLLRTCGCKFVVHPECWNTWMKNKTDWDCPICHKKSMNKLHSIPNPVINHINDLTHTDYTPLSRNWYCFVSVMLLFSISIIVGGILLSS
jgi:hypothetical protein